MGLTMTRQPPPSHDADPTPAQWSAIGARLRRAALALVGSGREAEAADLAQQALANVLARSPECDDLFAYARTAMVRIWLDEQRRLRRRVGRLARWSVGRRAHHVDAERASDAEALAAARAAVDRLPPLQRAAFVMRVVEELSYEQIASAVGSTPAAVRTSLHLARKRLRRDLGDLP